MNNLARSLYKSAPSTHRAYFNLLTILFLFLCSGLTAQAAPGDLDSGFGRSGIVTTPPVTNGDNFGRALALEDNGRVLIAGYTKDSANSFADFALARYQPDGTLDTSFGGGSAIVTPVGSRHDAAYAVIIQPNYKIIAVGFVDSATSGNQDDDFALVRYNSDGTLDPTFGQGGKVVTAFGGSGGYDVARAVALQLDGKIIVAGGTVNSAENPTGDFALARYNINGSLDTTFGTGGKVTTDFFNDGDVARSVLVQLDGKIVAVGQAHNYIGLYAYSFAVARYNTDGSLDTSFGNGGKATVQLGALGSVGYAAALQPNGKILVSGSAFFESPDSDENSDFALARFNTDGTLDSAFGNNGTVTTAFSDAEDEAFALTLQPNGKIVLAGYGNDATTYNFALARYNPNGALDSTFGNGGKILTKALDGGSVLYGIAFQVDGKLVVGGYATGGVKYNFALARYLGDPSEMLISEFRFSGPNGNRDEFIELYNNTDTNLTIHSSDGSNGWALASSDGQFLCVIPNGTIVPARGHFLAVNSLGYSLSNYGGAGQAAGDVTYTQDIEDFASIALFNTTNRANFNFVTRLDAVGQNISGGALYKEGFGYPGHSSSNKQYSFMRDSRNGIPIDTGVNVNDFLFVSTLDSFPQDPDILLGSPAPENLASPIRRENTINASLIDPTAPRLAAPNFARVGSGNSGTLSIRRRFTNNTGTTVTRLRFRIIDITTLHSQNTCGGCQQADLRLGDSTDVQITTNLGETLTVKGTTLEQPPMQSLGGGYNSSMHVDLPGGGLAAGQTLDVQFLMNVVKNGSFRFYVNVEALP